MSRLKHVTGWAYWSLAGVALVLFASGSQLTRLSIGQLSISALITILVSITLMLIAFIYFVSQWRTFGINFLFNNNPGSLIYVIPIVVFLGYVSLSLFAKPVTQGFQNWLSMCLFGIGLIVFSFMATKRQRTLTFWGIFWVSGFFAAVSLVYFLLNNPYIDGRAYAMTAVVGLAAIIPLTIQRTFSKIIPALIFLAILFSASRIATLAALFVIGFIWFDPNTSKIKNTFRMLFSYFVASVITVITYLIVPSTQKRLEAGDQAIVIGPSGGEIINESSNSVHALVPKPIVINTNGRIDAWREFIGTVKSPQDFIVGQGTGSSAVYGQQHLPYFPQVLNEYLRVFLDNGLLGLVLFIAVFSALFVAVLKPLKNVGIYQLSGFLVLMASSIIAITDGQFIYPFTALTSGLVVGLALLERAQNTYRRPI